MPGITLHYIQCLESKGIRSFASPLRIPDELMCMWCNRRWWDMWRWCILQWYSMAAPWCKSQLLFPLLFSPLTPFLLLLLTSTSLSLSVLPALCLHHSLCHPLPLCLLTLSSLQEVLELAFSVLYESDEYLNFIAPDKHEVSKHCPATLLLNVSETEGKSVTAPRETVVYMQV